MDFSHSTSVLSFYINVVLTLSTTIGLKRCDRCSQAFNIINTIRTSCFIHHTIWHRIHITSVLQVCYIGVVVTQLWICTGAKYVIASHCLKNNISKKITFSERDILILSTFKKTCKYRKSHRGYTVHVYICLYIYIYTVSPKWVSCNGKTTFGIESGSTGLSVLFLP